ncbi:MAG: radical SAM protein [Elusimicrobia bacterium]|nr:radical SAM protein [Elusimicrobiota bacterium]
MPAAKWAAAGTTAQGKPRARVEPASLTTVWLNTGTLCNIECAHCYIESSPRNDRLEYLRLADIRPFLDEARDAGAREIGFTGGEPFMNPDLIAMAGECLDRGFEALILTNAMAPMMNRRRELLDLLVRRGRGLRLRVSLDHHAAAAHDAERGAGAFEKTLAGLRWLLDAGFDASVAGRSFVEESEEAAREGYRRAIGREVELTVFPEMAAPGDLPEITTECWGLLGKSPESVMCASSRMVVKRRGEERPAVVACTLIPHDPRFELGRTLADSWRPVALQHPHCASFCVLGGGSCSP